MARNRRPYMAGKAKKSRNEKPAQLEQLSRQVDAKLRVPKKAGRPTIYTEDLANEICLRLSSPESMRSICSDENMPDRSTIARWMAAHPDFAAIITRARELQAEAFADEILAIADDKSGDFSIDQDGKVIPNWESVQRAKLRCDARRWYASKLAPKKFGEKVLQEHTGADGGPVRIEQPMTPAEVQAAISKMLDEAEMRMKLPSAKDMPNPERLQRILLSGEPITPELYEITQDWRSNSVH